MRAVQILGDASHPRIVASDDLSKPEPRDTEILIRVHAAGITGDEVAWPELYQTPSRIPGHEIAGTIAALGPMYSGSLRIGQEVFGCLEAARGQGQAEYTVCSANEVAPKPTSTSHAEAAALPIPLLTAWEAIVEHGGVAAGQRVLVTGASGAVGRLFIQLVKELFSGGDRVHVIALASARHRQILEQQLGASQVLDYETPGWEQQVEGVDLVFDTVGGDVLTKAWDMVSENGAVVTVADPPPPWAFSGSLPSELASRPNVRHKYFIVSPHAERMEQAAQMFENGSLKVLPIKTFPLLEAEQAWLQARERRRGFKIVLVVEEGGGC